MRLMFPDEREVANKAFIFVFLLQIDCAVLLVFHVEFLAFIASFPRMHTPGLQHPALPGHRQ